MCSTATAQAVVRGRLRRRTCISNRRLLMMTADDLAAAVGSEAGNELTSALAKIKHCLGQLTDEQVWWRSRPSLNSIGNLILHLCGNSRFAEVLFNSVAGKMGLPWRASSREIGRASCRER